jgi:flagellar protein FlaJ
MLDDSKMGQRKKIILISMVISIFLIVLGIVSGDPSILVNLIVISAFVFVVPIFLQRYLQFVWLRGVENEFPNFIRGLADSIRSGMSFEEAVKLAKKSEYGKLNEEIKKMSNRIQWGTSFIRSLEIFGEKVKNSRLITEALEIIKESYKSGGNVAASLDSIARNVVMFKDVEAERASMVKQHVMIMYGIFFMFLGIGIVTIFVMVPMVKTPGGAAPAGGFGMSFSDPCQGAYNTGIPCSLFKVIGVMLDVPEGISLYYTSLFFSVVFLLGLFIGLIAGQLGENSVLAGGKHSLIMITVTLSVFLFLAKSGLLPS